MPESKKILIQRNKNKNTIKGKQEPPDRFMSSQGQENLSTK